MCSNSRPHRPILAAVAAGVLILLAGAPAQAAETLAGPVMGRVVRVVDGDTLVVRARIWLGQDVETLVRLRGLDAPEFRGRCPRERDLAERARAMLAELVAGGTVVLSDVHTDKYGGRVLARVATAESGDIGRALIAAGLARAYDGRGRGGWCSPGDRG